MSDFWTDLARHLDRYERAQLEADAIERFAAEYPDRPDLEPEDRDLIGENDITDHADTPLARTA